jgi:hypothetical protein
MSVLPIVLVPGLWCVALLALPGCGPHSANTLAAASPAPAALPPSGSALTSAQAAESSEPAPSPAPVPSGESPRSSAEPASLPSGTTLLHVGDSMAGALGIELNRELLQHGVKGVLKYKTASFIPNWAGGEELGRYLAVYHPDLVIISLGTNELEIEDPERRGPQIERLVGRLGGIPCLWLLPPVGQKPHNGLPQVIRDHASPCICLDHQEVFPEMPRVGDKIHPTMAARKDWAERVVAWLARHRKPGGARPWELDHQPSPSDPNNTQ